MQVIKLSDAVQPLPRQATQYVHGAPECFLKIGDECSHETADGKPHFTKGAYTLGKMVWGKVSSSSQRMRASRAVQSKPSTEEAAPGRLLGSALPLTQPPMVQGWEELLENLEKQRDRGEPLPEIAGFGSGEADESVSLFPLFLSALLGSLVKLCVSDFVVSKLDCNTHSKHGALSITCYHCLSKCGQASMWWIQGIEKMIAICQLC